MLVRCTALFALSDIRQGWIEGGVQPRIPVLGRRAEHAVGGFAQHAQPARWRKTKQTSSCDDRLMRRWYRFVQWRCPPKFEGKTHSAYLALFPCSHPRHKCANRCLLDDIRFTPGILGDRDQIHHYALHSAQQHTLFFVGVTLSKLTSLLSLNERRAE